jgi:hypothetical protein
MTKRRYETDVAMWIVEKEEYRTRIKAVVKESEEEIRVENFTLDPSKWVLMVGNKRSRAGESVIRRIMEENDIDVYEYKKHNPQDFSQAPMWITVKGKKVERIY